VEVKSTSWRAARQGAWIFAPVPLVFFTSFDALAAIGSLWHFDFMNERISIHPRICHGQACIRGTRIPVHQIVRMFAHGDGIETLLKSYSTITREDILACLDYAASLAEEQVTPLDEIGLAR
jgi:uncharacterized protein (DUF433 family)